MTSALSDIQLTVARSLSAVCRGHRALAVLVPAALSLGTAKANNFTISDAETTPQTLASAQTGTVTATGSLTVSSTSTNAVTITGNNVTLTNLGLIDQTSTGSNAQRAVRDNTGVTGLIINNGSVTNSSALMEASDADVIQMNKPNASVTVNNYGTMTSFNASKGGAQALDFNAITNGSNVINNYSTGVIQAQDADAIRPGVNGVVYNAGTIQVSVSSTTGNDGIDAQTNGGVQITNDTTGLISGARHGITGGNTKGDGTFAMTISNAAGGRIQGQDGSGINIDGINGNEMVVITNHGTITGNGVSGDGDGVDVDGLVNLTNDGTIRSLNALNDTSEGVTVGGGTIMNSGTIQGSISSPTNNSGTGRGITVAGVDKDTNGNPIPVQAPYGATTITNSGLIKGDSDSGIAFTSAAASGFANTITNTSTGVIEGGGSTAVAVLTGADNDTLNNYGLIKADSSGKAIDLGGGNNALNILGGAASVVGDISGGSGGTNAMKIDPGAGNSFSYSGSIANFATMEIKSGHVSLSGVSTYGGTTIVSGGVLTLSGANRLSASSSLQLNGGTLQLANAAGADGQTFAGVSLTADSIVDLLNSSLSFNSVSTVTDGSRLTVLDWNAATSPDYAYRVLGNETANATFLALVGDTTIDGEAATYVFDGTYTDVRPVPLPAAAWLLLSGLGGLGAMSRRRKAA